MKRHTPGAPVDVVHDALLRRIFQRDRLTDLAHPQHAWARYHHWRLLARCAELPYADVARYRRELTGDRAFQAHLSRHLADVPYLTCGAELYVVVRALRPAVIIETGVASGVSSMFMLQALKANGAGELYSIDLPNVQRGSELPHGRQPGWIVPADLRARWTLRLGDSHELLPALLRSHPHVDLFFHDSDHSQDNMAFEFEQVAPCVARGGLFVSDDTHLHTAWDRFCGVHGLRPARVGRLGVTRNVRRPL